MLTTLSIKEYKYKFLQKACLIVNISLMNTIIGGFFYLMLYLSTFFSHVGTSLPGLNHGIAADEVSCSRTQQIFPLKIDFIFARL